MKLNTTCEIKSFTPKLAAEWMSELWGEQRSIRAGNVRKLAADMKAGKFKLGPDAILRINGKLANGQHRLAAVIQSDTTQQFLVMQSDDPELYKVLDAGLRRTVSDSLIGVPYAQQLPSVAKLVQTYESGTLKQSSKSSGGSLSKNAPSQLELIEYCMEHRDILTEAVMFVAPYYDKTRILTKSIASSIYVLASRRKLLEEAGEFLDQAYNGGTKSAAADLHARLLLNQASKSKLPQGYIFGITIKAFKSFCNGTRPGCLKWDKNEILPVL